MALKRSESFQMTNGMLKVDISDDDVSLEFEHKRTGVIYFRLIPFAILESLHDVFKDRTYGLSILMTKPQGAFLMSDENMELAYTDSLSRILRIRLDTKPMNHSDFVKATNEVRALKHLLNETSIGLRNESKDQETRNVENIRQLRNAIGSDSGDVWQELRELRATIEAYEKDSLTGYTILWAAIGFVFLLAATDVTPRTMLVCLVLLAVVSCGVAIVLSVGGWLWRRLPRLHWEHAHRG